ncbi:hypothetical protein BpHYR1_014651 [Brachionus plicatilis]|uniref:Uncharacterized protein n=1 Tax=Brachionus plicatilis TaxID=10195 RepID=A0A3M7P2X4_BRAPC|nr:hypothetical protein BpHYR1_014651 [Brachionus plicatilis]
MHMGVFYVLSIMCLAILIQSLLYWLYHASILNALKSLIIMFLSELRLKKFKPSLIWLQKIQFWGLFGSNSLNNSKNTDLTIKNFFGPFCGRPVCTRSVRQLAGHFTVGFYFGRPFHGRSVLWPALECLFKNGPQTAGQFTDSLKCGRYIHGQNRPFILAVQVRPKLAATQH